MNSFQGRLDDYQSIMDDDYDDRVVAEAKSTSSRVHQQRKSFDDATSPTTQPLGNYAKSSSNISELAKANSSSDQDALSKSVQSVADEKSTQSSSAGSGSKVDSPAASSRFHVARPHHLPKMNNSALSSSLDKIRKNLGEEVTCSIILCPLMLSCH